MAANLPRVRPVEFRRNIAESRNGIEVLFGVLARLPNQHIRIGIAGGSATPATEHGATVDRAISWLRIPSTLPVKAHLGGMRSPDLDHVVCNRGQGFLRIYHAIQLKSRVKHVRNPIAPSGHFRHDEVTLIGMSEKYAVIQAQTSP